MDRQALRALAEVRLADAAALLEKQRWAAAYYLTGYAVECGLKAALLRHLGESDALFGDPEYVRVHLAKCFTHDLVKLIALAGLTAEFGAACGTDQVLQVNWGLTQRWKETSRYQSKGQSDAEELYRAVTDPGHGVLQWIRTRW